MEKRGYDITATESGVEIFDWGDGELQVFETVDSLEKFIKNLCEVSNERFGNDLTLVVGIREDQICISLDKAKNGDK